MGKYMSGNVEQKNMELIKDFLFNRCANEPTLFPRKICGVNFTDYQEDIFADVWSYDKVAVKSCNGSGKSHVSGNLALTFCYTIKKSIIITTAPTARQVEKLIWKEIRSSHRQAGLILAEYGIKDGLWGDLMPKAPELRLLGDEWCILGVATNDPDKLVGFHSDNILIIIDEAAGVHPDIFSTIEDGILASGRRARMLMIGNPTNSEGYFYDTFKNPIGTKTHTISCFITPNFKKFGLTFEDFEKDDDMWLIKIGLTEKDAKIYHDLKHPKYLEVKENLENLLPCSYLIKPQKVYNMLMKYGKDSRIFRARALGEFPLEGTDSLIPMSWIEKSNELYLDQMALTA